MVPEETIPAHFSGQLQWYMPKTMSMRSKLRKATFWKVRIKQHQYLALRHLPSSLPFKCAERRPSLLLLWVFKGIRCC